MSFLQGRSVRIMLSSTLCCSPLVVQNNLRTVLTEALPVTHNLSLNVAGEKQQSGKNPVISGCHSPSQEMSKVISVLEVPKLPECIQGDGS